MNSDSRLQLDLRTTAKVVAVATLILCGSMVLSVLVAAMAAAAQVNPHGGPATEYTAQTPSGTATAYVSSQRGVTAISLGHSNSLTSTTNISRRDVKKHIPQIRRFVLPELLRPWVSYNAVAAGIPFRCLGGYYADPPMATTPPSQRDPTLHGMTYVSINHIPRKIPYVIMWPALIANAIVYAVVLYSVYWGVCSLFGWSVRSWRLYKRPLACPQCGYDLAGLGGSGVVTCPECGAGAGKKV